jgi:hypothetical protein
VPPFLFRLPPLFGLPLALPICVLVFALPAFSATADPLRPLPGDDLDGARVLAIRGQSVVPVDLAARTKHAGTLAAIEARRLVRKYALPPAIDRKGNERLVVIATLEAAPPKRTVESIHPYRAYIAVMAYRVDRVVEGTWGAKRIIVRQWGMRDGEHTPAADRKPGTRRKLTLDLFDAHPKLDYVLTASDVLIDDLDRMDAVPWWTLRASPAEGGEK